MRRLPTYKPRSTRRRASCQWTCPVRLPLPRRTRTISRFCTSGCSVTASPRANFTTTPIRRWASESASFPGVSQVQVFGAQSAVRIKADPSAMASRNITIDDLRRPSRTEPATPAPGNSTERPNLPAATARAVEHLRGLRATHRGPTERRARLSERHCASETEFGQDERMNMRFWARGR